MGLTNSCSYSLFNTSGIFINKKERGEKSTRTQKPNQYKLLGNPEQAKPGPVQGTGPIVELQASHPQTIKSTDPKMQPIRLLHPSARPLFKAVSAKQMGPQGRLVGQNEGRALSVCLATPVALTTLTSHLWATLQHSISHFIASSTLQSQTYTLQPQLFHKPRQPCKATRHETTQHILRLVTV